MHFLLQEIFGEVYTYIIINKEKPIMIILAYNFRKWVNFDMKE